MAKLNDKQAALFTGRNWGVIATIREDGSPQATPVWIDYDGEDVLVNSARGRSKVTNIERDPRATVTVLPAEDQQSGYVMVSGPATIDEEGAREHIDKLAKKYLGEDKYPYLGPGEQRVIILIRPERIEGFGAGGWSLLLAGGGGHELRNGLDLGRAQLPLERRHHGTAVRHLAHHDGERRLQLIEVRADRARRPGRGERVAPAAAGSLEDGHSVRPERRKRGGCRVAARSRHRGDVRGDVHRVLARDDVRGHRGPDRELLVRRVRRNLAGAEPDLVEDEVLDRALLIALLDIRREGVVEVRADRPARPGSGQRVAGAAVLGEELLAARGVRPLSAGARDPARATAGGEQRRRHQPSAPSDDPVRGLQPCGTPTADTASSRVG